MDGSGRPMDMDKLGKACVGLGEMSTSGSGLKFQTHYTRPGRMG
jgi:hypothetical protein